MRILTKNIVLKYLHKKCDRRKRIILATIVALTLFIIQIKKESFKSSLASRQRNFAKNDLRLLKNILDPLNEPHRDDKNIFLIESRAKDDFVLSLRAREACAVESAGEKYVDIFQFYQIMFFWLEIAITNPGSEVFLLFSYEVGFFNLTPLPIIDALLSYKNIHLVSLNISEYAKGSPVEIWLQEGTLFHSNFLTVHISDVLRMLTLWKYSGTYFDLDEIVKQPISSIGQNFACLVKDGTVGNAVINLDSKVGRIISESYFEELKEKFDVTSWNGNGPAILTLIAKIMCNTTLSEEMPNKSCNGFHILPHEVCYAIDFTEANKLFDEAYLDEVMERTKDSFAVHFYNSVTGSVTSPRKSLFFYLLTIRNYFAGASNLPTNSNSAYINLAKSFCPKVLATAGNYF